MQPTQENQEPKKKTNKEILDDISGQSDPYGLGVFVPGALIRSLDGDKVAALFIAQCVYLSDRSALNNGWFWKSYPEWENELGFTRREIDRILTKYPDLIKGQAKIPPLAFCPAHVPVMHFYIDMDALINRIITKGHNDNMLVSHYDKRLISHYDKMSIPSLSINLKHKVLKHKTSSSDPQPTESGKQDQPKNQEEVFKNPLGWSDEFIKALIESGVYQGSLNTVAILAKERNWTEPLMLKELDACKSADSLGTPGALFIHHLRNRKPPKEKNYADWLPYESQDTSPDDELDPIDPAYIELWEKVKGNISGLTPMEKDFLNATEVFAVDNNKFEVWIPNAIAAQELKKKKKIFSKFLFELSDTKYNVDFLSS